MECRTIKSGSECMLMAKRGCSYKNGVCHEIIDQCKGCSRFSEFPSGWYCSAYPEPNVMWRNGACNLATHVSSSKVESKVKVNPLKASKTSRK